MSNNEEEHEEEQESYFNLYKKSNENTPILVYSKKFEELTPKIVGGSQLTMVDYTEKFEERDSTTCFYKFYSSTGSFDEAINQIIKEELFQKKFDVLEAESKSIEEPDSTEIIRDEKSMETLSETNQFLVLKNDELTKDLKILTKNYEILTKDTIEEIARLNERIEELIESKVSVSRTPSYWVDEVFSEEFESENVEE